METCSSCLCERAMERASVYGKGKVAAASHAAREKKKANPAKLTAVNFGAASATQATTGVMRGDVPERRPGPILPACIDRL